MSESTREGGSVSAPLPEGVIWPTFEDGTPVRFGDEIEGVDGRVCEFHFSRDAVHVGTDLLWWWRSERDAPPKRRKPEALDADGVPINVGDTVWVLPSCETAVTVTDITPGNSRFPVRGMGVDGVSDVWRASALTHRRPDTQEAIDSDCMMDAKDYCEKHGIRADFPKHYGKAKCEHLLIRQRKLLGGE